MGDASKSSSGTFPEPFGDSVGPHVMKLLISDRQAGKLIGKHGSTVSQIGASCHVSIRVSASNMFFPNTTDRVVIIAGEMSNIESALRNVHDRIAVPMTDSQSLTVVVQSSLLTTFVGQGCANLHRAATEFNVSIIVCPRVEFGSERVVRIVHRNHFNSVMGALLSLCSKISSDPQTVSSLQMNYDHGTRGATPPPIPGAELYLSGITVEPNGITRSVTELSSGSPRALGSDQDVHLAAASLLPFDEIKVDTDLLRAKRSAEDDELICKICHTYFLGCAPKLTKCAHAFCGDCLESWIQVQPTLRSWAQIAKTAGQARLVPCPVCKTPLNDKTDIHLILAENAEPDCVRMGSALRKLPLRCHNSPQIDADSSCDWEGVYTDYQAHARVCTKNKTRTLIEGNTTAPPESHEVAKKINEITVVIPFMATPEYKESTSVSPGDKLVIEEDSENGWLYAKNTTAGTHGWIPDYCVKRYDAWFEELVGGSGKLVEKCAAIREFDPTRDPATMNHVNQYTFLPLREGEVFTVCERTKTGWNLVINSDGSKQGWVPDNRCKVIREGGDGAQSSSSSETLTISRGTFVVRRFFEGDEQRGELSLNQGETVSVRQAHDSGWTLGVVVTGGTRKEGWFPDWIIDRSSLDIKGSRGCVNCNSPIDGENLCTFVRVSVAAPNAHPILSAIKAQDAYGPICTEKCWQQWMTKKTTLSPKPGHQTTVGRR